VSEFDKIYTDAQNFFGKDPSPLLAAFHELIPRHVRVLDIGVGQGRNALFLARRGYRVVGIDTSSVGVQAVRETADSEGLGIEVEHTDILRYTFRGDRFGATLALGIIQVLTRDDVDALFRHIDTWAAPGGLVLVTAFLVGGTRHRECLRDWERRERNTFRRDGRIRTFLEPGEITTLLPGYEIVHHDESLGPEHRYADAPPERHFVAQLVARKPSG